MATLDALVKNEYFAIGVASNLLIEWGKTILEPPIPPIVQEPPNYPPPIHNTSLNGWQPHVFSWWGQSSVTVPVKSSDGGTIMKVIDYDYVNTKAGGIGGSGFYALENIVGEEEGEFWYACGEGGQYGKANDGNTFVGSALAKYQIEVGEDIREMVKGIGGVTDAKCIIIDGDTGATNVFVPYYFWGSGDRIQLKPNMYLYLIGGDGEAYDPRNGYWTCTYSDEHGIGGAVGFYFDDSIVGSGFEVVEIINNQLPLMSTSSFQQRLFDNTPFFQAYGTALCQGGRSCTLNIRKINDNRMYACAGGGGGAGVIMNDSYARARYIINCYASLEDRGYNSALQVVDMVISSQTSMNGLKGYKFSKGSAGLMLGLSIRGDWYKAKSRQFQYFSDLTLTLYISVQIEMYSGEKLSKKVSREVQVLPSGGVYLTLELDLNAEFSSYKLNKNNEIKDVVVTLNASEATIINIGGLAVTLIDRGDSTITEVSDAHTPTVAFSGVSSSIEYTEHLWLEYLHPVVRVPIVAIQDDIGVAGTLFVESAKKPKTPDSDTGVGEFLIIERGTKNE